MWRIAAGCAELDDLIVQRAPVAGEHEVARDDHIDLTRPGFDGLFDLGNALEAAGSGRPGNPSLPKQPGHPCRAMPPPLP